MELFLELVLTMALSLLLSFFISKIISTGNIKRGFASTPGTATMKKTSVHDRKFKKKLRNFDSKSEKRVRFVEEVTIREVEEFESESVYENFDIWSPDNLGTAEIISDEEDSGELAAVQSGESLTEEFWSEEEVKTEEINIGELKEENMSAGIGTTEEKLIEESPERTTTFREIEACAANSEEVGVSECCEGNERTEIDGVNKNEINDEREGLFDNDDDWEGIERTELERLFGTAAEFVGCGSNYDRISKLGSDIQMQLYGLHRVATEGPCRDSQPMALKVSARAKWSAWQQLGNMNPELAMEKYITLLSESISAWMGDDPAGDSEHVFSDEEAYGKLTSDLETFVYNKASAENDRKLEELKALC